MIAAVAVTRNSLGIFENFDTELMKNSQIDDVLSMFSQILLGRM
ncbi:hypothetical protein RINTU1_17680 [Candidatus Regiella insecticola]|uniref:Uncharacterized protein n=1 Tax=Candidatus Regiella insecticola TaxID=138073 RepID=A0A6L2ZPT9_9ENTR|nr:hypothetical protein RINTU1_17680 [Candidatus Regiella insecticola]